MSLYPGHDFDVVVKFPDVSADSKTLVALAERPEFHIFVENKTPSERTWRDPWLDTDLLLGAEGETEVANELHIENRQTCRAHQWSSNQQILARF